MSQPERLSISRVPQQVANLATGTGGEVRLELSPEGLGEISLRVSLTAGGDVAIEILADAESTVAVLGRLQETLESTLRAQGIELESFDVSHGGEGAPDANSGSSPDAADRSSDQPDFEFDNEADDAMADDTPTETDNRQPAANVLHL